MATSWLCALPSFYLHAEAGNVIFGTSMPLLLLGTHYCLVLRPRNTLFDSFWCCSRHTYINWHGKKCCTSLFAFLRPIIC